MIQNAINQSNLRTARGTFTISIIGFSPMLMRVQHFEIQSPDFSELLAYVESENIDQIKRFIESDHNANQREQLTQRTALYHAVTAAKPKVVEVLLRLGSDPNIPDFEGDSPLIAAVMADSTEVTRQLIDARANVNQANQVGTTPVMRAVELGRLKLLTLLLQSGADPNYVSHRGQSALNIAIDKRNRAAIATLRRFGASK